jgi:small subunit ribosomal protein S2
MSSMPKYDMRTLFEAGVHFGHLNRFREPSMAPYIYGSNNKINIINLEKTLPLFIKAMEFVKKIAERNGKILFVGTKRAAKGIVAEYASSCSMPYVNHRWLGGMLTNYKTIRQSIRRMNSLQKMKEDGVADNLNKKELLTMSRNLAKLENSLGGIKEMAGLPDAIFIIDAGYEKIAIQEANRLRIPVIAVVDTNSKPDGVDYMIPGNDDAMRAITLYVKTVADVINSVKDDKRHQAGGKKFKEEFIEVNEDEINMDLGADDE